MGYMTNFEMLPQFISIEGGEGAGKTTATDGLCELLKERGIEYVRTREPGGTDIAEKLRDILLDNQTLIGSDTELLLMMTARADHLDKRILPALAQGKWVICDRFVDSTVAYQGFGRYRGEPQKLAKINQLITHFVPKMPDVTFWLDVDPLLGKDRAAKRSMADRFENQDEQFFDWVNQGFLWQYQHHSNRIWRIDAGQSSRQVVMQMSQKLFGGY